MPSETPQSVSNELELYFNSNSPGDEIVPLEWWKNHARHQFSQTHNKIDPNIARACLCLKSWLEQKKIE
ncbi:hypothetical protein RCL_jg20687.t1 [Rhizophagus clarus]|uniref:Uncharacterized protein n=1 Tax=Rhizophagus clarus TaxID=94130 RepID=A0A8H3LIZ1_9GLOM|nr:hypothetical protein RCL_jg20687.t1 [Rhizophagus clarus]